MTKLLTVPETPHSRVMDRLFKKNPYDDFDPASYPTDFQGWNSQHPLLSSLVRLVRPRIIVEVGVWKGASAIFMADICKREGVKSEIICVDTWLGSSEHFWAQHVAAEQSMYTSLLVRHGRPDFYYTFLANVLAKGHCDIITPLPLDSDGAVIVLRRLKVIADLVHIDGGHEYETAARDIREYWSLLSEEGVLICDDYGAFDSVTKALNEFAVMVGKPIYTVSNKAAIPKGKGLEISVQLQGIAWQ